eukprot:5150791-Prymnesium_polylepis.2
MNAGVRNESIERCRAPLGHGTSVGRSAAVTWVGTLLFRSRLWRWHVCAMRACIRACVRACVRVRVRVRACVLGDWCRGWCNPCDVRRCPR